MSMGHSEGILYKHDAEALKSVYREMLSFAVKAIENGTKIDALDVVRYAQEKIAAIEKRQRFDKILEKHQSDSDIGGYYTSPQHED